MFEKFTPFETLEILIQFELFEKYEKIGKL